MKILIVSDLMSLIKRWLAVSSTWRALPKSREQVRSRENITSQIPIIESA